MRKRIIKTAVCLLILLMLLVTGGCSGTGNPSAPEEKPERGREETSGEEESSPEEPENTGKVMKGPQVPPAGQAYDEWQGIEYTQETEFDVKTFFGLKMYSGRTPEQEGFTLDPVEGKLVIISAKAEPVGGEMKLRSGGYVDIEVTAVWSGQLRYSYSEDSYDFTMSAVFQSTPVLPFDSYTGTALFNYSEGDEAEGIAVGEASDTGFIESDVSWKERTYRLFAREDHRNTGGGGHNTSQENGRNVVTSDVRTETVYTFRVPADYDGLALSIPKDISSEKPYVLSDAGDILPTSDLFADVLTDDRGVVKETDEFYFIKVSELLKKFEKDQS